MMAWSGALLEPVDPTWLCEIHARHLSYPEWRAGACFWCEPRKAIFEVGSPRGKIIETIKNMQPDELLPMNRMRVRRGNQG